MRSISFDALGQRDEVLRHRISTMVERLDDIRSLQDEFRDIIQPLGDIVDELPLARKRNAELEAMLAQEREALATSRNEAGEAVRRNGVISGELSELNARVQTDAASLEAANQLIDRLRSEVGDGLRNAEDLERRLVIETEQKNALTVENRGIRSEIQAVEAGSASRQRDLLEARSQIEVLDQDNRRLQALSEEQTAKLDEQIERLASLDSAAANAEAELESIRGLVAAEAAERQRLAAQLHAEGTAHRNERAGLTVKLDAANARVGSVEKVLAQSRAAIQERDETEQALKRQLKDALAGRSAADKRLEAVQEDLARQIARVTQAERERTELLARADMLTKAIAAKDSIVEQSATRNALLQEAIDESNARYAAIRAELETSNRRLTEELENERSERAMAQGALGIARESRAALQKQYDALKRTARVWREPAAESEEPVNNVTPFGKSSAKKKTTNQAAE